MEQKAYEDQEIRLYHKQVEEVAKAPLNDRKAGASEVTGEAGCLALSVEAVPKGNGRL